MGISKPFKEYELYASERSHKNEWSVEAYKGHLGRLIGVAEFVGIYEWTTDEKTGRDTRELVGLKGWDVSVNPEFRRRGIARAMYTFAEEAFGLPVLPGDFQTPLGTAFLRGRKKGRAA